MESHANVLQISLLGNLELKKGNKKISKFATHNAIAIFCKLALSPGKLFSRDMLAEMFWQHLPLPQAKKCLRTELWRIRKILDPLNDNDNNYLIVEKGYVGFNDKSSYWLDVEEFEVKFSRIIHQNINEIDDDSYQSLCFCVDVYKGDLLDTLYDEWHCLQREALRSQYLMALELLMRYHKYHSEWDLAISYGQQLLKQDPLLEHIHLELIRCHYLKGNRPAAIKQYIDCRRLLRDELGVSPMDETEQVYRTILSVNKPMQLEDSPRSIKPDNTLQDMTIVKKIDMALANIFNAEGLLTSASQQMRQEKG